MAGDEGAADGHLNVAAHASGAGVQVFRLQGGLLVQGTFPDPRVLDIIRQEAGPLPLIIADPPYGNIVADGWDRVDESAETFTRWMLDWTRRCAELTCDGGALYVWGGIGVPGFRPFYRYAAEVEVATDYVLANHITWAKKRAYGVRHNYLFTREELLYLVKGDPKKPRVFNVPLLDEKRPYAGYNSKYPAKSEYYRRTNVWTDITEILRGKVHTAQKPEKLHDVLIETHTSAGEWVLDPFCGSGTTGRSARRLGRKFILVENDPESVALCLSSLRS